MSQTLRHVWFSLCAVTGRRGVCRPALFVMLYRECHKVCIGVSNCRFYVLAERCTLAMIERVWACARLTVLPRGFLDWRRGWYLTGSFMVIKGKFVLSSGIGLSVIQRIIRDGYILFIESSVYCPEVCLMTRDFLQYIFFVLILKCMPFIKQ